MAKLYTFRIILEDVVDDLDVIDNFYCLVDDVSLAGTGDRTIVHFDREADSLDDALHTAAAQLFGQGWRIREISVEPACVLPMSTS